MKIQIYLPTAAHDQGSGSGSFILNIYGGKGPILVINDEGHHCHRVDPDKKNALPQNIQWFEGIQQIRDTGLLRYVVDMSATPIFLAQSNLRHRGRADQDTQGADVDQPVERIGSQGYIQPHRPQAVRGLPPGRDGQQHPVERSPEFPIVVNHLYRDYEQTVEDWRELGRAEPPVMAIVMNSVTNRPLTTV